MSHPIAAPSRSGLWLLVPLAIGAMVAVALGAYGRLHEPAGEAIISFGFSGTLPMKAWVTTGVLALVLVQAVSALVMYGWLPGRRPWVATLHRWSGRTGFLLTVPVAFHCLYSLGLESSSFRVLAHGLVGCFLYGVFAAKMLLIERRAPGWLIAIMGGLAFAALVEVWLTSSLWFFTTIGIQA